jgi:hypothetical protein
VPIADITEQFVIAHGAARLPKTLVGESTVALIVELFLDAGGVRILDVAATISVPGYTTLLRRLLVGRSLDEIDAASKAFAERYRGPLLRPTIAALTNAVLNHQTRQQADSAVS